MFGQFGDDVPKGKPRQGVALLAGVGAFALIAGFCVGTSPLKILNAIGHVQGVRILKDIRYAPHDRGVMDVYLPAPSPVRFPLIVFFYGGSWQSGEKADYAFVGQALAARGIATAVVDYRLFPAVRYPDFLTDCVEATEAVFAHASEWGGDPQRVFLMGHSAGAYNAAMVAMTSIAITTGPLPFKPLNRRLAGWIGLAGPYNFLPIKTESVKPVFNFDQVRPDSQPIFYAGRLQVPAFLAVAGRDASVNPTINTDALRRALEQSQNTVVYKSYPRTSHATLIATFSTPLRFLGPVLDDVVDFCQPGSRASRL